MLQNIENAQDNNKDVILNCITIAWLYKYLLQAVARLKLLNFPQEDIGADLVDEEDLRESEELKLILSAQDSGFKLIHPLLAHCAVVEKTGLTWPILP